MLKKKSFIFTSHIKIFALTSLINIPWQLD